jgi:hypothetical protein
MSEDDAPKKRRPIEIYAEAEPVKLGSMLLTLVEPHRGHEVAYNRWYERDHFYAGCMIGPWLFAGRRWVATTGLKDLRFGAEPELMGGARLGSYLATYFVIAGKHDEHFDWGLAQVRWLHSNGRMFAERDHVHTLLYRFVGAVNGDPDQVPPELALDHPFAGLVATLVEHEDEARDVVLRAIGEAQPAHLALVWSPVPLAAGAPVTQQGIDRLERRSLILSLLREEPGAGAGAAWGDHRRVCEHLDSSGVARVLWSAPFVPTVPGTDRYTDQLW